MSIDVSRCPFHFYVCVMLLLHVVISHAQIERWTYKYPHYGEARSIVCGQDNHIYAAGHVGGANWDTDIFVLSLTQSGTERWVYTYDGPGYEYDYANAIMNGQDGNIYITGSSFDSITNRDIVVISLTPLGDERWIYRYNGPGNTNDYGRSLAYGSGDNIYTAGTASNGFTVISMDTSGNQNWTYRYYGTGGSGGAQDILYGLDGNIYAGGASLNNSTDFTIVSLTPAGIERWVYDYDGSSNASDICQVLTYGLDGNLYAAGWSTHPFEDITIISLDTAGNERWVYDFNVNSRAYSVDYGDDGNIYVAGYSQGYATGYDFTTISTTSLGVERWFHTFQGGVQGHSDEATSIVCGSDGNIYVVGFCTSPIDTSWDYTVLSIASNGNERWVYNYAGADTMGSADDCANDIAYGIDGNLYTAGYVRDSTFQQFTVISLNPAIGIEDRNIVRLVERIGTSGTTIFTGSLRLPGGIKCKVFDITGRVVEPNKITRGIYFIEVDGVVIQKVVKVR